MERMNWIRFVFAGGAVLLALPVLAIPFVFIALTALPLGLVSAPLLLAAGRA